MKDGKLFSVDLSEVIVKDLDGFTVKSDFNAAKEVANLVYRSVADVDFLHPLQDLSKHGVAGFTAEQLDVIEVLVKKAYVLPVQLSVIDRIQAARMSHKKE